MFAAAPLLVGTTALGSRTMDRRPGHKHLCCGGAGFPTRAHAVGWRHVAGSVRIQDQAAGRRVVRATGVRVGRRDGVRRIAGGEPSQQPTIIDQGEPSVD